MVNDDKRLKDWYEFLYASTYIYLYSNVDVALNGIVFNGALWL